MFRNEPGWKPFWEKKMFLMCIWQGCQASIFLSVLVDWVGCNGWAVNTMKKHVSKNVLCFTPPHPMFPFVFLLFILYMYLIIVFWPVYTDTCWFTGCGGCGRNSTSSWCPTWSGSVNWLNEMENSGDSTYINTVVI